MLTVTLSTAFPLLASLALQAPSSQLARGPSRRTDVDSARVLREARSAQTTFERTRRANLPLNTRGGSGRCDVRVGRFCYWWDDGEFEPPPEAPRTKAARTALLERLARAARTLPGDRWIAGQRVRYLVEDERFDDAVQAARECEAAASWCAALAGYAHHAALNFAAADSAFAIALESMPERERCKWTDISLLLEGDARKRYDKLRCADRARFEGRFWALSRPLYLLPANDLRTEHLARLTMAELIRTSRYPHDLGWGDDTQELLVRYGWETAWSRESASISDPGNVHVVGHEPTPAFDFVPTAEALAIPDSADSSDWALHDRMAQSRYAPRYARSVSDLQHQIAFFRRGDSALVVAAFDVSRDSLFAHDSVLAALAVAEPHAPDSARVVRERRARRGTLSVTAAWAPLLVSVEARDSAARRVARAKTVVRPPMHDGTGVISDLLLFDDASSAPASLSEAIPRALASPQLDRSKPVGVFWELYGVAESGKTLSYTLTVVRDGSSWLRRAAEKLNAVERRAPVRMQWREPSARPGAAQSRSLAVDLSTLPEGRYRLELALEVDGQAAATASRVIDVR
ncbi:MAG TPA: hypothetical protein VM076_03790 [Gemmatimonadaceae bacterium]|nr:hypothetical protein [Gemmatimonadaceae bacterium]